MKILRTVSEKEIVDIFLRAEIESPRFQNKILDQLAADGKERSIIDIPNLKDDSENKYRAELLGKFRGYGQNQELFENFPTHVDWKEVELTKDEFSNVKYINYDYWIELSNGSRLPKDAAKNILNGEEVFEQKNDQFFAAAEALKKGAEFPEMIMVSTSEEGQIVVLEGHLRMTTYMLAPDYIPNTLKVIVGFSPEMAKWDVY